MGGFGEDDEDEAFDPDEFDDSDDGGGDDFDGHHGLSGSFVHMLHHMV